MEIPLILISAVVLSLFATPALSALTWGDIKGCATLAVNACHDKCTANAGLDSSLGDGFKKCEQDIATKMVTAQENCLKRNGWQITDSSPCFKHNNGASHRFRRQLFASIGKLKQYSDCVQSCQEDPEIKGQISDQCDDSKCDAVAEQHQRAALTACDDNGDSAKQSDVNSIKIEGITCLTSTILG